MYRYKDNQCLVSALDPVDDMFVFLEYLTSEDYVVSILNTRHSVPREQAQSRARQIILHMRTALAFLRQSLQTQTELSFLPAYYGILNLMKVYILVGPYHAELPAQRWHGATYPMGAHDSRSLLTEKIILKKHGAIPLFYRTLTQKPLPASTLSMAEVYPFVSGVTGEYLTATGRPASIMTLIPEWKPDPSTKDNLIFALKLKRRPGDSTTYTVRNFKVLRQFRKDPTQRDLFVGKTLPKDSTLNSPRLRAQFRPFMIYGIGNNDHIETPCCSHHMFLPEELPIALLFFHMSNVVRYKPETLHRIRDSRFWPILAAARRQALLKISLLTWSFVHNQGILLEHKHP